MQDEWKYIVNSRDCYINQDGDVTQDGEDIEPYASSKNGHRMVDILMNTDIYDHDNGGWVRGVEKKYVWQLMWEAWFANWPKEGQLHFVDGDKWNCSVHNIRAWSHRENRLIDVRENDWGFIFDKRLKGNVEIVEMDRVVKGVTEAAQLTGGTKAGVSRVLSGELERHRGYHFRWVSRSY